MKKEKILETSNMQAIQIEAKGATIAGISMLILAFIYYIYEIVTGKGSNPALYSIITIYNAILYGYKAIKIEKRRKLNFLTSVIWGILTILLILDYFRVV